MSKVFPVLLFIVALFIAGNAAYFSVRGIGLLFAGSFIPVVVMASSLELGKLFAVSLLYRRWHDMSRMLRYYLTIACISLVGITSLGIFGFLTDAYQDTKNAVDYHLAEITTLEGQNKTTKQQVSLLQSTKTATASQASTSTDNYKDIYDKYEKRQTSRIGQLNDRLAELDKAMSNLQASPGGLFSSKKKKIEQLKLEQIGERAELDEEIDSINSNIKQEYDMFLQKVDSLSTAGVDINVEKETKPMYEMITENEKRILDHRAQINATDIGSFKFIADAFDVEIEDAVKWFIILLVVVFDPLAICLVIGFNMYVVTRGSPRAMDVVGHHGVAGKSKEPDVLPTKINSQNKKVVILGRK